MDILEAYERTLDAANDLRAEGVKVEITPSTQKTEMTDYLLPRDKWVIIVFRIEHSEQAVAVKKKADALGWAGIRFDTSGGPDDREWEVDWSFNVGDVPDAEWQDRREEIEDLIDGDSKCPR